MRRTKIVCTLGPSSATPEVVRGLVTAGMNVARLNFSHGDHDDHAAYFRTVRDVAAELERDVAVMADLQGPRIRTGPVRDGNPVFLKEGEPVCLTTRPVPGDSGCISTTYDALPNDVTHNDRILIADGALELRVEEVAPPDVQCRVVRGGYVGANKGINLPGVVVSATMPTEKDVEDLDFAIGLGVDFVALSFVRDAREVRAVKQRIADAGAHIGTVAKIERVEAVNDFTDILEEAEAVMVARGDLGVELDLDDVPQIQKRLIGDCNAVGKPVITATQMLESMMEHRRPTRAEAADIANAVYDGTDAVMLSGETAAGKYPVDAVHIMARVVEKADLARAAIPLYERRLRLAEDARAQVSPAEAIGEAARRMTEALDITRIVCFTLSGSTALAIARYRPQTAITALTMTDATCRRCGLYWGIDALRAPQVATMDKMIEVTDGMLLDRGLAAKGDTIIVVAGTPLAEPGRTNLLKLHTVGEAP